MTIEVFGVNGKYIWSAEAFAQRCVNLLDGRNLTSLAAAQAALSSMSFTAAGFLNLKKILADLVLGSIAFPADQNATQTGFAPGVTEVTIGTRDVSSTLT